MWKLVDGKLVQTSDNTRVAFRTNISESLLHNLAEEAEKHNTHLNYMIENGLMNLFKEGSINYNKKLRPKDRIQYKTTYDKELLKDTKRIAKENKLNINDLIELSTQFIQIEECKKRNYRYRTE
ncbi:hypothetical protein HNO89_003245 [Sporosarcina luteola]|nr:hypothetical protein [Sporosarcina luteola]